jgi:hypothetical protein
MIFVNEVRDWGASRVGQVPQAARAHAAAYGGGRLRKETTWQPSLEI